MVVLVTEQKRILWPAADLCKKFGPRSGLTDCTIRVSNSLDPDKA